MPEKNVHFEFTLSFDPSSDRGKVLLKAVGELLIAANGADEAKAIMDEALQKLADLNGNKKRVKVSRKYANPA